MEMPSNYAQTQVGWESLAPGGHRCIITKVEETKSQAGNQMLVIYFDTHQTDTQPKFFSNRYLEDRASGKAADQLKWRGVSYWTVDEKIEGGTKRLKQFNTAVEDSNPGFQTVWGAGYCKAMENKLVGIVFREEEYTKGDGSLGVAVKPMRYCNFEKAYEQKVPDRKPVKPQDAPIGYAPAPAGWQNQVNAQGYFNPQAQPSTQAAFMRQQAQPQFQQQSWQQAASEGFMQADPLDESGLPWNT